MKFPDKPNKPPEPKEPDQFIDFKFSHQIYEGFNIFSAQFKSGLLKTYNDVNYYNGSDIVNYLDTNWDKLEFNSEKEYEPYGDSCYIKNTLDLFIPKEAKVFVNPNYKNQYKKYQALAARPLKMSEYKVKLRKWEFERIEVEKELERARKLLKDAGEL